MKKAKLIMAILFLFGIMNAELLLEDNFTGTTSTLLTANGWTAHSGSGTTPMSITTPGLTYTGYLSSGVGNATSASGSGEDVNKGFTSVSSGSVYYSLLLNASTTNSTAGYPIHFARTSGSSAADYFGRLFIQKNATTGIRFGITKQGTVPTYTGYDYSTGTTYLIIVRYTFNTGSTTDDVVSLWVNPVLGSTAPTPTISHTETSKTDVASIAAFAIRQYDAGQLARFDGIRVGTSWSDVGNSASISAPTTQASDLSFPSIGQTGMTANWTSGDGAKRVVIMNTSNSFTDPTDGTDPSANTVYSGSGEQVVYNNSSNTVAVTGLSASTTYWFRVYEYNGSGATTKYLTSPDTDNPKSQSTLAPAPLITLSEATLTGFTYVENLGPSTEQTFTVLGENLTNNISIAASTNYEISKSSGSGYTTPLTFTPAEVATAQTVYVRLKAGLDIATYNGETITATSTGAANKTVTCSGSVTAPSPSATILARPSQIDLSSTSSESAVLVQVQNYSSDDAKYRLYNNTYNYNAWDTVNSTYISSNTYSDGPNVPGTPTTSSTWWIPFQRGNNNSTIANYRDRLNPYTTAAGNNQTVELPEATAIQTISSIPSNHVSFNSGIDYSVKYVILGYDAVSEGTLVTATSTTLTTGAFSLSVENGTTIRRIEIRSLDNTLIDSVTGTWPFLFDYPANTPVPEQGVTVTVTGGNANAGTMQMPDIPNGSFNLAASFVFSLDDAVANYTITIQTAAPWGAYYQGGEWNVVEGNGAQIVFNITFPGGKADVDIPVILGDGNPTLPVELSSFTATMNASNNAVLTWVTQTETGVSGFYIYRNTNDNLVNAEMVSNLIPATNTSSQQVYVYTDTELQSLGTYYYWLQVSDMDGADTFHGPITLTYDGGNNNTNPVIPTVTRLSNIFPNPFNPSTQISYSLAKDAKVRFEIFNSRGQLVRSIEAGNKAVGNYTLVWNGVDNNGTSVPTGVYYIRMHAGADSFSRKAVLMK